MKIKISNISKIISWNISTESIEIIENKDILIESGKISQISNDIVSYDEMIDAKQCIVTPGFIDTHTHPVFIGNRANEFELRAKGKTYQEISKMGGGIKSSVNSLRQASEEELYFASYNNIKPFIHFGTTTLEAKSGYGLSLKDEVKSLKVLKKINESLDINIIPTFLGAHDFPDEFKNNKEEYVRLICEEMIPQVAEQELAVFCDVFCEEGYFNHEQTKKICNAARINNLEIKLHVDEFKDSSGAYLAGELNATSADHLMKSNVKGLKHMAKNGVIATILPGTTLFLGMNTYANGRQIIDAGCDIALASDYNPGSCTIYSLPIIMALSCLYCGLSVEDAFKGVTYNAAKAINRHDSIGLIKENYFADLLFWDIETIAEIPYWFNSDKLSMVMKKGKLV